MENRKEILDKNVKMMGLMLDEIILESEGEHISNLIKEVRELAKDANMGKQNANQKLFILLQNLKDEEFLPIARAFNQFLNLTNTAEQNIITSPTVDNHKNPVNFFGLYEKFKERGISDSKIKETLLNISIDLVLTAHPTEINRRSLINNLNEVDSTITWLNSNIADYRKNQLQKHLKQLIAQYWYTDEIRQHRPTPNEEAKWGYEVIESSLWYAVPQFLKELDNQMEDTFGFTFPIEARPIHFSSWMGGDRDGNPNVTAKTTSEVLKDSRIRATKLFLKDIELLVKELSMRNCTKEFREYINDFEIKEPYRKLMMDLRAKLRDTVYYLEHLDSEGSFIEKPENLILHDEQLWVPLLKTYNSLLACGMNIIAKENLQNTLRRLKCFGLNLCNLDIRQESSVHCEALGEITRYLSIGDYETWDEEEKVKFLLHELKSNRPLIPLDWNPSEQTAELLETCKVIASTPEGIIPTYVISMTQHPSDILAVYLLLKKMGCKHTVPVTPLFETLTDLNNSEKIMSSLFEVHWYQDIIKGKQMIMIGYSDSAKDAGVLAAGWAQYRSQEALFQLCERNNITLTLFHGRGGSIGRGGAPAHDAIFSQPPNTLKGGLRVTEQGEMIRFKFSTPYLAIETLCHYTDAVLEANLLTPPSPKKEWRDVMDDLSTVSCDVYQGIVKQNSDFIPYFYEATPEAELSKLPLGSRPAKRRKSGGLESLRAIPWIFGWTQNRLMLPSWLGSGTAYNEIEKKYGADILFEMNCEWPFFSTRISMLEMVFAKSDIHIAEYYDERLVEEKYWYLGNKLREMLKDSIKIISTISKQKKFEDKVPYLLNHISLRNVYINPLNVLQVELLHRCRANDKPDLEEALMVTISGIAAGMRNSG